MADGIGRAFVRLRPQVVVSLGYHRFVDQHGDRFGWHVEAVSFSSATAPSIDLWSLLGPFLLRLLIFNSPKSLSKGIPDWLSFHFTVISSYRANVQILNGYCMPVQAKLAHKWTRVTPSEFHDTLRQSI
jgi:hypothetical protein